MSRLSLSLAGALLLCACAAERRSALPPHLDPASPDAPEAPPALAMETEPAAAPGTYTCPMHPEVQSDRPGRCPKCGMPLVPEEGKKKEQEPKQEAGHEHHHHGGTP